METIATTALVLSVVSLMCCGALLILCLALLRPNDSRYTELAKRVDRLVRQADELSKLIDLCGEANKQLFRYVEALDDVTGGTGHSVFLPARVPSSTAGGLDSGTH